MKRLTILVAAIALLLSLPSARAQNNQNSEQGESAQSKDRHGHGADEISGVPPQAPLKIVVVISEYDGTKKITNLPYTLYTTTEGPAKPGNETRKSMRYQVRVPISVGSGFQYQEVGTNIDYGAYALNDTSYQLVFTVDRSWAAMPGNDNNAAVGHLAADQLMVPDFREAFIVVLKSGQTVEGASATDPVTGHVLKVDVTLTVLK